MKPDATIPKPRVLKPRLTLAHRALKPSESVLVSEPVAACVRAYGRGQGWVTVQRREAKLIRVWRIS